MFLPNKTERGCPQFEQPRFVFPTWSSYSRFNFFSFGRITNWQYGAFLFLL